MIAIKRLCKSYKFLSIVISLIILAGCTTVNLQMMNLEGPINLPGIHTRNKVDTSDARISLWASYSPKPTREGLFDSHSAVNSKGVYSIDTVGGGYEEKTGVNSFPFNGSNFKWTMPDINAGINLELMIYKNVFLFFGGSFARLNDNSYWTCQAGYGYYLYWEDIVLRQEVGYDAQSLSSSALYALQEPKLFDDKNSVSFQSSNGIQTKGGVHYSLTLFSKSPEKFFNLFFQTSFQYQKLNVADKIDPYDANITTESRGMYFFTFTPGVALNLNKSNRLYFGVRIVDDFEVKDTGSPFILIPMLQLESSL